MIGTKNSFKTQYFITKKPYKSIRSYNRVINLILIKEIDISLNLDYLSSSTFYYILSLYFSFTKLKLEFL